VINWYALRGRSVAIDAYNTLYQFLSIIRQPDGTPLRDSQGRITSHLSGILYRNSNLIENGVKLVYIFDGPPPSLKTAVIKQRRKTKEKAEAKYEKAKIEGRVHDAYTYAQATSRIEGSMEEDSKRLLNLMGIPWVQAPSEGEAQAAYMTRKGDTDFCGSQDYDSLLFGAPLLVRNLTISGRRKLPKKPVYVDVVPEVIKLDQTLRELDITYEQLVEIGILVGTDYNPDGVKGIGPRKALKLIKEHGNLEGVIEKKDANVKLPFDLEMMKRMFLNPKVSNNYKLEWNEPDNDGVINFLCRERDFTESRVQKALDKIRKGIEKEKARVTLDSFF